MDISDSSQKVSLVLYTDCYISKMLYLRQGEQGLDTFYKPWHEIVYYRYIRFFSEGKSSSIYRLLYQ